MKVKIILSRVKSFDIIDVKMANLDYKYCKKIQFTIELIRLSTWIDKNNFINDIDKKYKYLNL